MMSRTSTRRNRRSRDGGPAAVALECVRSGVDSDDILFMSRFTQSELDVTGILLDLPNLLSWYEIPLRSYSGSWRCKKKRSEPPSVAAACGGPSRVQGPSSSSPTSPLEFKSKVSTAKASTLSRVILRNEHDKLTKEREKLIGEVAKIQSRLDELKAENRILKGKWQKLQRVEEVGLPNPIGAAGLRCVRTRAAGGSPGRGQEVAESPALKTSNQLASVPHNYQRQSLMVNQTADSAMGPSQFCEVLQYNYQHHHVGPSGVPDLNVSAEEYAEMECSQPLNLDPYHHIKLLAKERRRNRLTVIQKRKISSSGKSALGLS